MREDDCPELSFFRGIITFDQIFFFLVFIQRVEGRITDIITRFLRRSFQFLLVLPSFSSLHKKEVGRVLLRGQFWRKKKIRRFSKPIGRRKKILSL